MTGGELGVSTGNMTGDELGVSTGKMTDLELAVLTSKIPFHCLSSLREFSSSNLIDSSRKLTKLF